MKLCLPMHYCPYLLAPDILFSSVEIKKFELRLEPAFSGLERLLCRNFRKELFF